MANILLNFKILAELSRNGERTSSALHRILDTAKIKVDQALDQLHENGLVEKREIEKEISVSDTTLPSHRYPFSITEKGEFTLRSVNVGYFMIEKSLEGDFDLEHFKNVRKENSPKYIG